MRLFELLNIQDVVLYFFPGLIAVLLVAAALAFSHFHGKGRDEREDKVIQRYPSELAERNAPFPLFLFLLILGTVIWGIGYILIHGLLGVKI
jgi:hypothetical protein